jgi:hypothetical protein
MIHVIYSEFIGSILFWNTWAHILVGDDSVSRRWCDPGFSWKYQRYAVNCRSWNIWKCVCRDMPGELNVNANLSLEQHLMPPAACRHIHPGLVHQSSWVCSYMGCNRFPDSVHYQKKKHMALDKCLHILAELPVDYFAVTKLPTGTPSPWENILIFCQSKSMPPSTGYLWNFLQL